MSGAGEHRLETSPVVPAMLQPAPIGEICVRGLGVMLGYWHDPDALLEHPAVLTAACVGKINRKAVRDLFAERQPGPGASPE